MSIASLVRCSTSLANPGVALIVLASACGSDHAGPDSPSFLAFTRVTAGYNHTCGVTTGGDAFCWGLNQFGSLGDAGDTNTSVPTAVTGGQKFVQLSIGGSTTCGIATVSPACGTATAMRRGGKSSKEPR